VWIAALALIAWYVFAYWLFIVPSKHVDVKTLTPVDEDDVDDDDAEIAWAPDVEAAARESFRRQQSFGDPLMDPTTRRRHIAGDAQVSKDDVAAALSITVPELMADLRRDLRQRVPEAVKSAIARSRGRVD